MATGASMTGGVAMKAKLQNVARNGPRGIMAAVGAEMEIERLEVVQRTPVLSGKLRSTIKLIGPYQVRDTIIAIIIAGGREAPYALIVHEDLEAFHRIGQAKYLESVLMESRPHLGVRIANRLSMKDWVR